MDTWDRLFRVFECGGLGMIAYIYRIGRDGKLEKPFLAKMYPDDEMLRNLRDEYFGGDFRIMIREDRKLIFSGVISIVKPYESSSEDDYSNRSSRSR